MQNTSYTPVEILLVEDNEADVYLTRKAFEKAKLANRLSLATDGVKALAFLRREGNFADAPRPDIVFLDLNLPRKSGYEVLTEIKKDPDLKRIPVIILTSSKSDEDVFKTYDNYANCFISKPVKMEDFEEVIRKVEDFWFCIVRLPPKVAARADSTGQRAVEAEVRKS